MECVCLLCLGRELSEWELGYVFSFACASIGDSNFSCRCSQNGKACLAPILLADVVSVGSRVVSYHDGLLVVDVLMYAGVCGKADMLVLVDDPFGEWITDCVLMATRLEPNNGQTAHTKLSTVDEQEPLLNDLIGC
jgi:hypothetical protein